MFIFAWNIPSVSLIFLKRSLVFPSLSFSSISLHWTLRKWSYLSLLFFGTLHSDWYNFPFLLSLSRLLLSQLFIRPPQTTILPFLHFFFLEMVFISTSYTIGEGNGNPLQYSRLENPMDRGAWRATDHGVARAEHNLVTNHRPIQCHELLPTVLQALCLPDLILWIYLSLSLYKHKGFDLGHIWMV